MAVPLSNLTATFTSAGGNTAIKMTVTDTANSENSNLINFIVNGEVKFRVDRNGNMYANTLQANTVSANNIVEPPKFSPVTWILA